MRLKAILLLALLMPSTAFAQYKLCVNSVEISNPQVPITDALVATSRGVCPDHMVAVDTPAWWRAVAAAEEARGMRKGQGQALVERPEAVQRPFRASIWQSSCSPPHPVTDEIVCDLHADAHDAKGTLRVTFPFISSRADWLQLPPEVVRNPPDGTKIPGSLLSFRVDRLRPFTRLEPSSRLAEYLIKEMLSGTSLLVDTGSRAEAPALAAYDLKNFAAEYAKLQEKMAAAGSPWPQNEKRLGKSGRWPAGTDPRGN